MPSSENIQWAFNSATIMNCPWDDELSLWQEFGWNAAEIWYTKLQPQLDKGLSFEHLARQMREAGVAPIGMCAAAICTPSSEKDDPEGLELPDVLKHMDAAAAIGASSLTIITGGEIGATLASEYELLIPKLRRFAEMAADRDIRINFEFLGGDPVNGTLGSCIDLVNAVDHPAFGLLFDFCHYYVSASHIEELPLLATDKLFMVHVNGTQPKPMEVVRNEERCFPDEGRMDVAGMMHYLRNVYGYEGYYSIELYDPELWKLEPRYAMQRLEESLKTIEAKLEVGLAVA